MEQLARRNAVVKEEEVTRTSWSGVSRVGSLTAGSRGLRKRCGEKSRRKETLNEDAKSVQHLCGVDL